MSYYKDLFSYYFINWGIVFTARTVIFVVAIPIAILNIIMRMDAVLDLLKNLSYGLDGIAVLKPVGPTFKAAVKFWRSYIEDMSAINDFAPTASTRKLLIKHCAGRSAGYVGFRYLRAVRYARQRLEERVKNNS